MSSSLEKPSFKRPVSQWPVGMRLRFKPDADLNPQHLHLRGTLVIVLSPLTPVGPSAVNGAYSWRQQILSFARGCTPGWARPDQLELPADELEREPDYAAGRRRETPG